MIKFKLAVINIFLIATAFSQIKIGYVDSEYIMNQLPEAREARTKLNAFITKWQSELKKMETELKAKKEEYERRKLILTDEARAQMEKEIKELDEKIKNYRNEKFGPNGEIYRKERELIQPIQIKIFNTVKEVAEAEGYDYVFDKSGDILFLYANPKYDLTQKVLEKLLQQKETVVK